MALIVVKTASGGLPITQAPAGLGQPCIVATNGYGTAVTVVASGGMGASDATPGGGLFSGIQLSGSTFTAGAAAGTAIGTFSVSGGSGTYTFTLTDSASNKVQVAGTNGVNLQVGAAASAASSFPITVQTTGGAPNFTQTFLITALPIPPSGGVPTISGSTVVGGLLTATTGTWAGSAPITYAYQWKRAGANVGSNVNTYTLVEADIGSTITVTVTATNAGGSASATSAPTAMVGGIAPVNTVAPVIGGTPTDGQTLTVTSNGTWTGSPTPTYGYQWKSDAANVGTNSTSYTLVTGDVGASMTCVVTGTNTAGSSTGTSNALGPVAGAVSDTTPDPFTFVDATGVALSTSVLSNFITVSGIDAASPMTITGGEYSRNGGAYSSAPINVFAGNNVRVRGMSSASNSTTVNVTLTIGGVSDTFSITTVSASGTITPTIDLAATSDLGLSFTDNITNVNTPAFDVVCMTTPVVGDTIDIAKDGIIVTSAVLTSTDIAGTTVPSLGTTPVADGTYAFTARHTHAGSTSAYSPGLSVTIDTVTPTLTLPSGIQNSGNQANADLSVTTNENNGQIYWVVTPATMAAPTPQQVIDHMGADGFYVPAGKSGNFAVSSTGAKTATAVGFSGTNNYKVHWTHTDVAGNNASTSSSLQWTQTVTAFAANGIGGFDGSTLYYTNTVTPASSIAAGKQGLVSCWLKVLGGSGTQRYVFTIASGGTIKFWVYVNASNAIQVQGRQASGGTDILNIQSVAASSPLIPPSGWVHCALAWDLGAGIGQIYINGVPNLSGATTLTNDTLGYNQTTASIGAGVTGTLKFNGSMSELYVNLHETLDLSNPANLFKFRDSGGNPVFLGTGGLLPTGTAPEYYQGSTENAATWGSNHGTKGNMVVAGGTPTNVTGPP